MKDSTNEFSDEELALFGEQNTAWLERQGSYTNDPSAIKKLRDFYKSGMVISQWISVFLIVVVFLFSIKFIFFTNFEVVILDDGSQLFCTIEDDGSVAIAH